jgi:beta-lactamase regulating signal transducer with metallopeptidase domain
MSLETQNLCARLAMAGLNGLYQGMLLSAGVAILLGLLRWTNAATRHAVWFATLVLVFALIPAHYFLDPSSSREAVPNVPAPTPASARHGVSMPSSAAVVDAQESSGEAEPRDGFNWDVADKDPEAAETALDPGVLRAEPGDPDISKPVAATVSGGGFPLALHAPEWSVGSERMSAVVIIALLLWGIVAGWRLCLLVWGLARLNNLARGSAPIDAGVQGMLEELRLAVGVSRAVSLRCSPSNRSPVVLGFFRPMILLPAGMANDSEETRQVLSHELAHVRRCDDWANLFQHFVQAMLFFHPAVWWIGNRLSLEREIACDDHVLQQGVGSRKYALALAAVASRIREQTPRLAPGISVSHSQLQQRIDMILNTRRNSSTCLAKGRLTSLLVFGVVMTVAALYAAPRVVVAASTRIAPSVDVAVVSDNSPAIVAPVDVRLDPAPEASSVSLSEGEPGPTPSPDAIESGPKIKPEPATGEPTEPPEVASVPQPPASPDLPSPRMGRAPKAKRAPRSFDVMDDDGGGNGSVEQRLDRLEKLVRSLVDQNGMKRSHTMIFKDGDNQNGNFDQKQLEKMKQLAERQAARAMEQADRVTEVTKRATRDMEARLQDEGMKGERGEGLQRELEALRKAKEGLGQQMERLEREIKKIEKQPQRGDADQQRRGEKHSDKLDAENLANPESNGF